MRVIALLLGLLPASTVKNVLATMLIPGWSIDRSARFFPSLLWGVRELRLGPRSYLGAGNIFRSMRSVTLADGAEIGQFNWFSAAGDIQEVEDPVVAATLTLRCEAAVTSRHYVDCSGGVELGRRAVLGGVRSTILSHSADVRRGIVRAAPVRMDDQAVVFTGSMIGPGVRIGRRVVVAAGAVTSKSLTEEETMYGGVPARPISSVVGAKWFERSEARLPRSGSARDRRQARSATVSA